MWVFRNISVALERMEKMVWFGNISDLRDVGVVRKACRSVQIGDGDVVGIVVVENIVQTLERAQKILETKYLTLIMERIEPEVASMKSVREDGSETSIFLKPSAIFYKK